MPKPLTRDNQRDKDLIKDYKLGLPTYKLNAKYGISSTRIYQILDHYEVPRNNPKKTKKKK